MDTWTIISTLITGMLLGMFAIFGAVALALRSEKKEKARRREEAVAARRNEPVAYDPDPYDPTK